MDGLALGEHIRVSLGSCLVLVQPLESGALRSRAVDDLDLDPIAKTIIFIKYLPSLTDPREKDGNYQEP